MKRISERVLAVIMSLTIIFGTGTAFAYAKTDVDIPSGDVIFDENDPGYNAGKDHLTTQGFFDIVDTINAVFKKTFGFNLINENKIKVEVNGVMNDIFTEWTRKSGGTLDIMKIVNSLPDFTEGSDKVCDLLKIDVDTLAPIMKDKANELYKN